MNDLDDMINSVIQGDCLEVMRDLPDGCVDLVCADVPYNINKGTWDKRTDYIDWMGDIFTECSRILKQNGTLYYFHMVFPVMAELHSQIISRTELRHLQMIVIDKGLGAIAGKGCEQLRTFPRATEYIQMYGFTGKTEWDKTGLLMVQHDINNYKTLRVYFKNLLSFIGSKKSVTDAIGGQADHCFRSSSTQWSLPTLETYQLLIDKFNIRKFVAFREYEELRQEYEELRQEYEELRRPFTTPMGVTDVWQWNGSFSHASGHNCEKPIPILKRIIEASSKPGDLILDPFCGSGSTLVAAKQLGRRFIGIEISEDYCRIARERLKQEVLSL